MSKINKYANLYDKDGNLIRKVDEITGKLEDYTLEELEQLVDQLSNDKDENGKIRKPVELNNVNFILMQYYQKYGNPHLTEILEKLKQKQEEKSTAEQVQEKLEEVEKEVNPDEIVSKVESNLDEEYAEFEEIK